MRDSQGRPMRRAGGPTVPSCRPIEARIERCAARRPSRCVKAATPAASSRKGPPTASTTSIYGRMSVLTYVVVLIAER